jgi:hypothetical protein
MAQDDNLTNSSLEDCTSLTQPEHGLANHHPIWTQIIEEVHIVRVAMSYAYLYTLYGNSLDKSNAAAAA